MSEEVDLDANIITATTPATARTTAEITTRRAPVMFFMKGLPDDRRVVPVGATKTCGGRSLCSLWAAYPTIPPVVA